MTHMKKKCQLAAPLLSTYSLQSARHMLAVPSFSIIMCAVCANSFRLFSGYFKGKKGATVCTTVPKLFAQTVLCLQNETAPKSFNFKTKNGPKNDPKLPRKILSLVLLCRISHRHYSKIFHREFPRKIKYFFTTRICRHGHANRAAFVSQLRHGEFTYNMREQTECNC